MANQPKLDIFERRMININGDLQERVIYQRHMADDIFQEASGVIDEALLTVASGILAEPFVLADVANNVPNPHYIYSLDNNVVPDNSGTRSVGTAPVPWGYGYFDTLAGYTVDGDIIPTASGTQNTGTRAVPFAEGVFDSVVASDGWNGTFLTGDARTVTVTQGIITNVA